MHERGLAEMEGITIRDRLFTGKKDVPWDEVEKYQKRYIGKTIVVESTGDAIRIPKDFPDEYAGSQYTKKLRGAAAKAKAKMRSSSERTYTGERSLYESMIRGTIYMTSLT